MRMFSKLKPMVPWCIGVFLLASSQSFGAEMTIVLLDENNQKLEHGEATVFAHSPTANWTTDIGYLKEPEFKYWKKKLRNSDVVDLTIYTSFGTKKIDVVGLYGRVDQVLYLKVSEQRAAPCGVALTEWGFPGEYQSFLEDLERVYPDGLPKHMTNTEMFLRNCVLPAFSRGANSYAERVKSLPPSEVLDQGRGVPEYQIKRFGELLAKYLQRN